MSLMRHLWLSVIVAAIISFIGSLLINVWSTQSYLSQQLERKNSDIANSLALSLTQIDKGKAMIDLQVAALFDTGYYQSISVSDSLGRVISIRQKSNNDVNVPSWFVSLFRIESKSGVAEIGTGSQKYGSVHVVSHDQFAYRTLWDQAIKLLLWFCLIGVLVGFIAMMALRAIGRSLDMVVDQAAAIGERRLMTIAEPKITELKALARAMNGMVERIWRLFNDEAARIDELRKKINYDQLTSLPNRDCFMAHLKAHLAATESAHCGVIVFIRLTDLTQINSLLGRSETDNLLCDIGNITVGFVAKHEDALSGRIKAGEFAMMLPGDCDADKVVHQLSEILHLKLVDKWTQLNDIFRLGAIRFERSNNVIDILSKVDHALTVAEGQSANSCYALEVDNQLHVMPSEQWHSLISDAVKSGNLQLELYPVLKKNGKMLHQEGMVRLRTPTDKQLILAGEFMPIASHFNLTPVVDMEVVRLAVKQLANMSGHIAINISAASIANWNFRSELSKVLRNNPSACEHLWIEVSEYGAFKYFDAFKDICFALKGLGCHVGVEQFGHRLSEIKKITELGLDYVKLHSSLVDGIEDNAGNQEFIRRFCEIVHTVGVRVIAVGVHLETEWETLQTLGIDGVSGPVVLKHNLLN